MKVGLSICLNSTSHVSHTLSPKRWEIDWPGACGKESHFKLVKHNLQHNLKLRSCYNPWLDTLLRLYPAAGVVMKQRAGSVAWLELEAVEDLRDRLLIQRLLCRRQITNAREDIQ